MIEFLIIVLFLVAAGAGAAAVVYKIRSNRLWVIDDNGFIPVKISDDIDVVEGRKVYKNLRNIERMMRKQCNKLYKRDVKDQLGIKKIKLVPGAVSRKHKYIKKNERTGELVIGMQLQKFYLFARECHNGYRKAINGKDFVHEFKSVSDKLSHDKTNEWIEASLGHLNKRK